jgi:hypothetical protein
MLVNIPYHFPFDPVLMKKSCVLDRLEVSRLMDIIPAVPPESLDAERAFQTDHRLHQFALAILPPPFGNRWESMLAGRFVWLLTKTS